jgi:hypothetical protein
MGRNDIVPFTNLISVLATNDDIPCLMSFEVYLEIKMLEFNIWIWFWIGHDNYKHGELCLRIQHDNIIMLLTHVIFG